MLLAVSLFMLFGRLRETWPPDTFEAEEALENALPALLCLACPRPLIRSGEVLDIVSACVQELISR